MKNKFLIRMCVLMGALACFGLPACSSLTPQEADLVRGLVTQTVEVLVSPQK